MALAFTNSSALTVARACPAVIKAIKKFVILTTPSILAKSSCKDGKIDDVQDVQLEPNAIKLKIYIVSITMQTAMKPESVYL